MRGNDKNNGSDKKQHQTNGLIIQHNYIDRTSHKFVESNTKSEKRKNQHRDEESSRGSDKHNHTVDESKDDNNNTDGNDDTTITTTTQTTTTSIFNRWYSGISDWIYLTNFNFFCNLLKFGPIPQHIGVIMDGNRRFARKLHINTSEGHKLGFAKMLDLCQWGLALGVKIISVYAFSIENFKRPQQEVEDLMELANKKFEEMIDKSHKLQKMGIRIRVVGDISLIPDKTKEILARAVKATSGNTTALLNICMSYTSHDEMLHSMNTLASGVLDDKLINIEDIDQKLFEKCMYIEEDLDILVRTSGEYRLSDFMLWQSCFSGTNFLNVLWPDFSSFHFFYIIFLYQINHEKIKEQQQNQYQKKPITNTEQLDRIKEFIQSNEKKNREMLDKLSSHH